MKDFGAHFIFRWLLFPFSLYINHSVKPALLDWLVALKSPSQDIASELKQAIVLKTTGTSNGVDADDTKRTEVQALVNELEKLNKETKLTSTPRLDGNWKLLFTTNDGSSAGKIGPFVGKVEQDINLNVSLYSSSFLPYLKRHAFVY